ncbi:hypothetical protein MSHI_39600 [Mycobacterium shinjukuense]|uniref:Uncharacterized protein n=2 Tax=Mycobacterium shinjukuense TaxID=398694 RepID=A0A7I7MUW2_9MYCO|nr:hypothetical protein MSHI_39600 [Mycobacterium shinjukuense]
MPVGLRLTLLIAVLLTLAAVGFAAWTPSPHDDWARLPKQLGCRTQDGPRPPGGITVAAVEVNHPRSSVLELVIRFAQPLPQSPTGSHTSGFVGYVLTYSVANNGKKFVELGPEDDTDDLSITSAPGASGGEASMRPDRDTNARRTAPDTIQVYLDLKRLGIDNQEVVPELTVESRFNTPSITTVQFATQVCR